MVRDGLEFRFLVKYRLEFRGLFVVGEVCGFGVEYVGFFWVFFGFCSTELIIIFILKMFKW